MVLVIDTSSVIAGIALIEGGNVLASAAFPHPGGRALAEAVAALRERVPGRIDLVVVARGPGSFTGLRSGVAYGLGLAMGAGLRLATVDSLVLAAAASPEPARGIVEAGRGRVYYQDPAGPAIGTPEQIPPGLPLAGHVKASTAAALVAAGHRVVDPDRLLDVGQAAGRVPEAWSPAGYATVEISYMNSIGVLS